MNNLWIIPALATNQAGDEITSEEVSSETQTATKAEGSASSPESGETPKPTQNLWTYIIWIPLIVVMFMMIMGPRKKQQQQQKMVQSLKKNDRVRTIGGILGTVIEIKDNEVTLKIDESNNTKMKVTTGAIATVLSSDNN